MNVIDYEISNFIKGIEDSNNGLFISDENTILQEIEKINENIISISKQEFENYKDNIKELELENRIQQRQAENLLVAVINILDSIEWLLNNSIIFSNEGLKKTVNITKKLIDRELDNIKIIRTPNVGDLYNDNYHICLGYKKDEKYLNDQIINVIKVGYIFRDKVLRQGEVIVVNNNMEEENEYNRD